MNLNDLEMPTPRSVFDDVLTKGQIAKLENLNEDPELVDALRKVILFTLYKCGTVKKGKGVYDPSDNVFLSIGKNPHLSKEDKGERVEAAVMGITAVKMGFDALKNFRKIEEKKSEEKNPAK